MPLNPLRQAHDLQLGNVRRLENLVNKVRCPKHKARVMRRLQRAERKLDELWLRLDEFISTLNAEREERRKQVSTIAYLGPEHARRSKNEPPARSLAHRFALSPEERRWI